MVYSRIIDKFTASQKQFVVLVDPEKTTLTSLNDLIDVSEQTDVDMYFVGGSTLQTSADEIVRFLKTKTNKDVVLFPGNVNQITQGVDAVLFLSLVSGRNPEYLIGSHVKAASKLKGVEVIPVGYLLIDGGIVSATQRVTDTEPLSSDDVDLIVDTALASELLGHKMVYLEAGSGALVPVCPEIIKRVKSVLTVPLIVGGGIKTKALLYDAYDAGADIVVVGNVLEDNPHLLSSFL